MLNQKRIDELERSFNEARRLDRERIEKLERRVGSLLELGGGKSYRPEEQGGGPFPDHHPGKVGVEPTRVGPDPGDFSHGSFRASSQASSQGFSPLKNWAAVAAPAGTSAGAGQSPQDPRADQVKDEDDDPASARSATLRPRFTFSPNSKPFVPPSANQQGRQHQEQSRVPAPSSPPHCAASSAEPAAHQPLATGLASTGGSHAHATSASAAEGDPAVTTAAFTAWQALARRARTLEGRQVEQNSASRLLLGVLCRDRNTPTKKTKRASLN